MEKVFVILLMFAMFVPIKCQVMFQYNSSNVFHNITNNFDLKEILKLNAAHNQQNNNGQDASRGDSVNNNNNNNQNGASRSAYNFNISNISVGSIGTINFAAEVSNKLTTTQQKVSVGNYLLQIIKNAFLKEFTKREVEYYPVSRVWTKAKDITSSEEITTLRASAAFSTTKRPTATTATTPTTTTRRTTSATTRKSTPTTSTAVTSTTSTAATSTTSTTTAPPITTQTTPRRTSRYYPSVYYPSFYPSKRPASKSTPKVVAKDTTRFSEWGDTEGGIMTDERETDEEAPTNREKF